MGYIRQDVNWYLLVYVAVAVVVVVGLAIFFSQNFLNINEKYDKKVSELTGAFGKLTQKEGELGKTQDELNLKKEREEKLTGLYSDVQSQKEELEGENAKLKGENEQYKVMVEERDDLINSLQRNMTKFGDEIDTLEASIEALNAEVNRLKSQGCS